MCLLWYWKTKYCCICFGHLFVCHDCSLSALTPLKILCWLYFIDLFYYDLIFNLWIRLESAESPSERLRWCVGPSSVKWFKSSEYATCFTALWLAKKTLTDPDMKSDLSTSFYRCNVVSVQTGSGFTHTYVSRQKQIWRDVICKSLILKVKVTFLLLFFYFKTVWMNHNSHDALHQRTHLRPCVGLTSEHLTRVHKQIS